MTEAEFESRIVAWARQQSDITALIQIGSRVQKGGYVDRWSDWDFHLITSSPKKYYRSDWVAEIALPWCVHTERSLRGRVKISAIFENGLEADFIPLSNWQMKVVYGAMQRPDLAEWMPRFLRRGILETREILLNSGYRVLLGGTSWEKRMAALESKWPQRQMAAEDFERHVGAFWQKSVWVMKKIARPEPRSAMHWFHKLVIEHSYALLAEEAWISGRGARPEALKAEKWLEPKRLAQTDIATSTDPQKLALTLLAELELFEDLSRIVAASRGFPLRDYSAVADWMRSELSKLAVPPKP